MNDEAIEAGKVAPQPVKRYLTTILVASVLILSGITGAGITAAFLMAKSNDHDSCYDKLPHFLGHLTVNEDTVTPEHGTIQGEAVEQLHALVTTSDGTIASGQEFDVSVKLHVPTKNSSTNHTSRQLSELPQNVYEVKLHVKTTTFEIVSSPANNSLREPAGDGVLEATFAEWKKDSVSPYLTLLQTEGTSTAVAMLCSRDKCVFAGEGQILEDKIDARRELYRLPRFRVGPTDCYKCVALKFAGGQIFQLTIEFAVLLLGAFGPAAGARLVASLAWIMVPTGAVGLLLSAVGDVSNRIYKGGCLPGDALLQQLINGQPTLKPIASVPHGAHVLTSGGFSPIYLFSHKDHKTTAVMRHIETESGHAIQLTRQHYIQADGQYMSAEKVAYGMQVPIRFLNGTLSTSAVHTVLDVEKQGLFNPMTMRGDVVVFSAGNSAAGVVVSDQSEWWAEGYLPESIIPSVYHTVLSPVRFLHSIAPAWTERFQAHTSNLLLSIPGSPSLDHLGFSGLVMAALHTSRPLMSMNSGSCVNILGK